MLSDTKFRRETSNFKINFIEGAYITDPNAEDPTATVQGLLQILPKNLGAEDFIGMITTKVTTLGPGPGMNVESWCIILNAVNIGRSILSLYAPQFVAHHTQGGQVSWGIDGGINLWYYPETGYLVDNNYDVGQGEAEHV